MSKLNKDILYFLFEELHDSKSLFSCLMVNKLWCETIIPILWKNPWCYSINYYKNSSLYYIIISYLTDDIKVKELLIRQGIHLPQISHQPLLFDYLSFCKSINVSIISNIIQSSSDHYSRFILQQEFYNILIRKCSGLRYLDMRSIEHQLFYLPEARVRLDSLCELECDTSISYLHFYGLAPICQNIQRLIINNTSIDENCGIVKLIDVQKNLKYFEWVDDFIEAEFYMGDPYKEYSLALAKKANTLNHLIMSFQYLEYCNYTFLQNTLSELHKLKTLKISGNLHCLDEQKLKTLAYNDLEVFTIDYIAINTAACMIKNSGRHLRKILFRYYDYIDDIEDEFDKDSLTLIRTIHENCPLVEYLSLVFSTSKEHFAEFEKLLKACQNLRSLLLVVDDNEVETDEEPYKNGEKLLKILTKSSPDNLKEIRLILDIKISLKALEKFLKKWKGRPALSILTSDSVYNGEDYVSLINKYKNEGVIKDFKYEKYETNLYY